MPHHCHITFHKDLKQVRLLSPEESSNEDIKLLTERAYQKGREDAESFYNMQLLEYRKELAVFQEQMAQKLDKEYGVMLDEFKSRIPSIILSLLKKIWACLDWDADMVRSMVDEALMPYSPGENPLEVYLSATDMALFEEMDIQHQYGNVVFKEDLSLSQGDCLVKSRFGLMDSRMETKLKRVQEELSTNL